MGKPNTAAYRTLGAFYRPVRPPDSDRPALPTVAALDESFRGKIEGLPVPVLCEGVYEPLSSRDTRAMKHASLVAFVIAALRCVVLRCVAPLPMGGVQPPHKFLLVMHSYITILISKS
jgi:hypothetical protein